MEKDYRKEIAEIRSMMERSSRFISLSGLSGILAGLYALIAAFIAFNIAYTFETIAYEDVLVRNVRGKRFELILIAISTLALACMTGIALTRKKAKKLGIKSWDQNAKKVIINLFIPLITGGIIIVIFYQYGLIPLIAPMTLIFYGLGLINASHYTYRDIRLLGLSEVLLGLIACVFTGYGLLFWAIGFGLLHIIYGTVMYFKYDK
jgi:hypothetical protein